MSSLPSDEIRGIVFDLDGTLYVCELFAAEIQSASECYIAGVKGISLAEASQMMAAARLRLTQESGCVQTISALCVELGGSIRELHLFFEANLCPEAYLVRDERVAGLLEKLAARFSLYVYT